MTNREADLVIRVAALKQSTGKRYIEVAAELGLSEGEMIAAHQQLPSDMSALSSQALLPRWSEIIQALESVGEVMALTRNPACVHEKTGVYQLKSNESTHIGLVIGTEIDLRLFYKEWAYGFAVTDQSGKTEQISLQFFDHQGVAIHKVYLKPTSNREAFFTLVSRFQSAEKLVLPPKAALQPVAKIDAPDDRIDINGFRTAWRSLRDTHEFFGLLKQFGVSRTQGLRLAEPEFAQAVDKSSTHQILESAASLGIEIMVFVVNHGVIQIHTGTVTKIEVMGPWLNVLDPGFNLHLREDLIANSWVVRKPTVDGLVTSLEIYDEAGNVIAMFFGARKPGKPERCEWRRLIDGLLEESTSCAA